MGDRIEHIMKLIKSSNVVKIWMLFFSLEFSPSFKFLDRARFCVKLKLEVALAVYYLYRKVLMNLLPFGDWEGLIMLNIPIYNGETLFLISTNKDYIIRYYIYQNTHIHWGIMGKLFFDLNQYQVMLD